MFYSMLQGRFEEPGRPKTAAVAEFLSMMRSRKSSTRRNKYSGCVQHRTRTIVRLSANLLMSAVLGTLRSLSKRQDAIFAADRGSHYGLCGNSRKPIAVIRGVPPVLTSNRGIVIGVFQFLCLAHWWFFEWNFRDVAGLTNQRHQDRFALVSSQRGIGVSMGHHAATT
jgi:hypothetical protein